MSKTYFISGIDTDCGKTMITGLLARELYQNGIKVITQKLVQTGSGEIANDLLRHREIMGIDLQEVDLKKVTCPYVFRFPASPHLSARMENTTISPEFISQATKHLERTYDTVLLEGAGGLMVPIKDDLLTIDYLQAKGFPLILVSSSRLGSINHTLLSIEACLSRKIEIKALIYNHLPNEDSLIARESVDVLKRYLYHFSPKTHLMECPEVKGKSYPTLGCACILT
ncbi:dethiobiotin synthase [Mangrovibacterium lignilyticum]|uniref:dethiobiotin synthase n=1 Tax=Mangrovibacterium lignilyticum TaxID=2668052 RepID=UPI0013CFA231|nr:dethiobiotin synthase [Mangrovibacterium lignilyticum]